jgi:hypothetical protein
MAIGMALHGGIGIVHANFSSIEEQANEVLKVKRYKQGFITHPQCIKATDRVRDLIGIKEKFGFTVIPCFVHNQTLHLGNSSYFKWSSWWTPLGLGHFTRYRFHQKGSL